MNLTGNISPQITVMPIFLLTRKEDSHLLQKFLRENPTWDVKLALDYRDLLKRIIRSVLDSCAAGLKELDAP